MNVLKRFLLVLALCVVAAFFGGLLVGVLGGDERLAYAVLGALVATLAILAPPYVLDGRFILREHP